MPLAPIDWAAPHDRDARRLLRHHQRPGHGVREIITPTTRMIDCIATATGCPTLEREQLTLQPIILKQRDGCGC